jgi:hypothetical protein
MEGNRAKECIDMLKRHELIKINPEENIELDHRFLSPLKLKIHQNRHLFLTDYQNKEKNIPIFRNIIRELLKEEYIDFNSFDDRLLEDEIPAIADLLLSLLLSQYELDESFNYSIMGFMLNLKKKKRKDI